MFNKRVGWFAVCLVATGMMLSLGAWAQETNSAKEDASGGDVSSPGTSGWSAGVTVGASWHSNPYFTAEGRPKSEGMIYTLDPYVGMDYQASEYLYFGGKAKLLISRLVMDEEAEGADDRDVIHPVLQAQLRFSPSESMSFGVSDEYQTANIGSSLREPRFHINKADADVAYAFGSLRLGIGYCNTVLTEDQDAPLFDFVENKFRLGLDAQLAPTWCGRRPMLGLECSGGERVYEASETFKPADNPDPVNPKNPKGHSFYSAGARCEWPISPLFTAFASAGMDWRQYDFAYGNGKEDTDSVSGGLTIQYLPSESPFSFSWANSYRVESSLVYSTPEQDRLVFDATDPLINNLPIQYREVKVLRTGAIVNYRAGSVLGGVSATFQQSRADSEEDLGPNTGNSGASERELDMRGVSLGAQVGYDFGSAELRLAYMHGDYTDEVSGAGDQNDISYDAVSILLKVEIGSK